MQLGDAVATVASTYTHAFVETETLPREPAADAIDALARRPVYVSCTSVSKRRLTVWPAIPHQERKPTLEPRGPLHYEWVQPGKRGVFSLNGAVPVAACSPPFPGVEAREGGQNGGQEKAAGGVPWCTAMRTQGESNRARPSHSAQVQARTGHAWLLLTSSATALVVLTGRPSAPRLTEPGRLHLVSEPSGFGFFLRPSARVGQTTRGASQ